jgi:galactose mutarotase-like enzyme
MFWKYIVVFTLGLGLGPNPNTIGNGGKRYSPQSVFALEVQHLPDAPNKPHLPSTIPRAGQRYHETTILRFLVESG